MGRSRSRSSQSGANAGAACAGAGSIADHSPRTFPRPVDPSTVNTPRAATGRRTGKSARQRRPNFNRRRHAARRPRNSAGKDARNASANLVSQPPVAAPIHEVGRGGGFPNGALRLGRSASPRLTCRARTCPTSRSRTPTAASRWSCSTTTPRRPRRSRWTRTDRATRCRAARSRCSPGHRPGPRPPRPAPPRSATTAAPRIYAGRGRSG